MERLRDRPSSSSYLEQRKALLRDTIVSLTAPESEGGESSQQAEIHPTKKPREVDFLQRIHLWLTGGKRKISEVQSNKNEGQEMEYNLEHKDRIERLEKRVEELEHQNKCKHRLVSYNLKTALPSPETKLIGSEFEQNATKLMGWLKDSQTCMIGVWGMGGVGKTALVTHIYNKLLRDTTLSWPICWINASECDNVYKWQESLANCFEFGSLNEEDEMKRRCKLFDLFSRMENIVLILDDMWQPFSVHEVGIPVGKKGCQIILTTRSLEVCQRMGCKDFVITVHTLPEEEAWDLFVDKLENYDTLAEDVDDVARSIVERCEGLPLGIITMADHMIGMVDINEWKYTLHELENYEQGDMEEKVFPRLQRSFDQLNDEMVQNCFLSSIFYLPVNELIEKSRLIEAWVNEGLFDDKTGRYPRTPYQKGLAMIRKLLNLCLLTEDDDGDIQLHYLIRDMGIHLRQKNNSRLQIQDNDIINLTEVLEDEFWSEDLLRVALHGISEIPDEMSPKCPRLTVLDFSKSRLVEIPESFFVHLKALTVLDLSETRIVRLPESVCNLKNLRTLLLRDCYKLAHVPSLTKLMKLKVLDLQGALNIEGAPMVIENLKSLDKLKFTWNISDLTHFNRFVQSHPFNLHRGEYQFEFYNESSYWFEWLDPQCKRRVGLSGVEFGNWEAIVVPRSIEQLMIKDCVINKKSLGDALPSLRAATTLKSLCLNNCESMEYIFSATQQEPSISPQPNSIEDLEIKKLPNLRGIIELQGSKNPLLAFAFSRLRTLYVRLCPKIRNVNLEEIFESSNEDVSAAGSYNLLLPNLRVLDLAYLPRLGGIRWGLLYTSLSELHIYECDAIEKVFSLDLLQQPLIPNLKKIEVRNCQKIEVIFVLPNNNANHILALPNLEYLRLEDLPKLDSIYRGLLLCTSIQTIDILECPKYRALELPKPLICDKSQSTLASLPKYDADTDFWMLFRRDYPKDERTLADLVDDYWRSQQSWSLNSTHIPSQSAPDAANQGFPPHYVWKSHNAAQVLPTSYIPEPEIGNAEPTAQVLHSQWPYFPVNNQGTYAPNMLWDGGQYQHFK